MCCAIVSIGTLSFVRRPSGSRQKLMKLRRGSWPLCAPASQLLANPVGFSYGVGSHYLKSHWSLGFLGCSPRDNLLSLGNTVPLSAFYSLASSLCPFTFSSVLLCCCFFPPCFTPHLSSLFLWHPTFYALPSTYSSWTFPFIFPLGRWGLSLHS